MSAAPRAVPRHGHPDQPYRDRLAMLERTPIHWGGTFLGRAIARPLCRRPILPINDAGECSMKGDVKRKFFTSDWRREVSGAASPVS